MSTKTALFAPTPSPRQLAIASTLLRVVTGTIFIAHGAQKLFVFGFSGVTGAFGQMGVPFPGVVGPMIAFIEFFGGIALMLGLLTRLAALGISSTMIGAILLVHIHAGFFNPTGVEFPLSLLGAALSLILVGAGPWSVDAAIAGRSQQSTPNVKPMRKAA